MPATSNTGYTANTVNQYTAVGGITPTGACPWARRRRDPRDANGNLTFDGTWTYGVACPRAGLWPDPGDTEGRLASATGAGHSIAYGGACPRAGAAGPEGRLGQETVDAGTPTSFYYDGAVPMSDFTMALFGSGGGQIHRQVFGANDAPLYLLVSGVGGYAYQDGLGSVVALANGTASPAGALAGSYGYDAYGIAASSTGPVFRYAAARYDALPGLLYMNARFYHPALGRFMQPDPIGYTGGNNLYAYAGNDPVNLTDPSGLCVGLGCGNSNPGNQLIAPNSASENLPLVTPWPTSRTSVATSSPLHCQNVECGAPMAGTYYPLCQDCYNRLMNNPALPPVLLENGQRYRPEPEE